MLDQKTLKDGSIKQNRCTFLGPGFKLPNSLGTSVKQLGKTEPGWIIMIIIINKFLLSLVGVIRTVWLGFFKSHVIHA